MQEPFPQYHWQPTRVTALLGAVLLACSLILIIPLTQIMEDLEPEIITYREVVTLPLPPPLVPPSEQVEPQRAEAPPLVPVDTLLETIPPKQLDLSLNPGIGDAVAMGVEHGSFATEVDVMANIKEVFTFADLPQAPQVLNTPRITYPQALIRRGIKEGKVIVLIEINEQGRARVLEMISSTHPKLEPVAKRIVKGARFTIPKVNGEVVKVRGKWPLHLQAPL